METQQSKLGALRALEQNGIIAAADLIDAAREPDHPCHNDFTWDDAKAANERRHDQAREVIRRFHFCVEVEDFGQVKVPTYLPVVVGDDRRFRSTARIRSKSDVQAIFDAEIRQLLGVASRVLGIAEAKRSQVGDDVVVTIRQVCRLIGGMVDERSE